MRFSSISNSFFVLCSFDTELLENKNRRPYVIILRLKYKGKRFDFAIPFRSNIPTYVPTELLFPLPPRETTKDNHLHGLHYVKMFPIQKFFLSKFYTDKDPYYQMLEEYIGKNLKTIIEEAQTYLNNYADGNRPEFSTNIDGIIEVLFPSQKVVEQSAATKEL